MKWDRVRRGVLGLLLVLCGWMALSAVAEARPKVALVLSGGGAKGAAHLGVLKVLEAEHVPVDIVVGSSMGAYVAGMYAMGYSADEVIAKTQDLDWSRGYQDKPGREVLSLRKKQQADEFQLQADVGLNNGRLTLPEGVYQGQGLAALLRDATSNLPAQKHFDDLPIPYRAVATDMETFDAVAIDHGNLAQAMQASMSIPGALRPVELEGRLLADGGIVNNLPVDVARQMGADVIIAVDISAQLKTRQQLDSALGMIDQLTTYMTRAGTERQLALLHERDILLTPEVNSFSVSDFASMRLIQLRGESAARGMVKRLQALSLSPAAWRAHLQARLDRRAQLGAQPAYYIDHIEVHNHSRLDEGVIRKLLAVPTGEVQTTDDLEAAVARVNAQGTLEQVGYQVDARDGRNVLVVDVKEKSWGPNYLDFTLGMEDDFHSRSDYTYGLSYTLTNLTPLGAEWRNEVVLGSQKHFRTEWYAPLDERLRFYTRTGLDYRSESRPVYLSSSQTLGDIQVEDGSRYVTLESGSWKVNADLGWNRRPWSRFELGVEAATTSLSIDGYSGTERINSAGPHLDYLYDTLDSRAFPSHGDYVAARLSGVYAQGGWLLPDGALSSVTNFNLFKAMSPTERQAINLRLSGGSSTISQMLPMYLQDLGGLFSLSGMQRYQLNDRYKLFGAFIYRYRLLDNDFGAFRYPVYAGWSLERGNVWHERKEINWNDMYTAGSVYLGADTLFGPVYLAYGRASAGEGSFYLFFGNSFGF